MRPAIALTIVDKRAILHMRQRLEMMKENRVIALLIGSAFLLRACFVLFFADLEHVNYWEYGEIARNLHAGKGYSLFSFDGERFTLYSAPGSTTYPSAYMPPGYVAFLYPFFFTGDLATRTAIILLAQAILGAASAFFMFRFMSRHVSRRAAPLGAAIMGFLPEFVYASGSITPTVLFHLLFLALLPLLYELRTDPTSKSEILAAVLMCALIYVRSEIALFAGLVILALLVRGKTKSALRIGLIVVILILPWQIRNLVVFGEWVPFTTNAGLNFFRGHNNLELGTFSDDAIFSGLRNLPPGKEFEPAQNRLYFRRALDCISEDPAAEVKHSLSKFLQLWFWNPSDSRTTSAFYLVPWFLLLVCAIWGALRGAAWKTHWILVSFILYSTAIALAFFVLPRYQTMMKVALVPFAATGILAFRDHIRGRRTTTPSGEV